MPRRKSSISPDWWDYTTIEPALIQAAALLTIDGLEGLSRPGFKVVIYDTLEDFYLAQALEYVNAWREGDYDNPVGVCGQIGPVEHLRLVARLVNSLEIDLSCAHFWAMDEWFDPATGKEVPVTHPLSFERANRELWYNRIRMDLRMPEKNLYFPKAEIAKYKETWKKGIRCVLMQGGQGDSKHWAFNDPLPRAGQYEDVPPSSAEYRRLATRVVDLHPLTIAQNARTSGGGNISIVPTKAITVGPVETWKAEKVSIWHNGSHDNPFGQRLTAYMIAKRISNSAVPMSLLAEHSNVQFNYFRGGIGSCAVDMP